MKKTAIGLFIAVFGSIILTTLYDAIRKKGRDKTIIHVKPFVVIGKEVRNVLYADYELIDRTGYIFKISDMDDKYSIGDSIK